jgi:hypothetical protein
MQEIQHRRPTPKITLQHRPILRRTVGHKGATRGGNALLGGCRPFVFFCRWRADLPTAAVPFHDGHGGHRDLRRRFRALPQGTLQPRRRGGIPFLVAFLADPFAPRMGLRGAGISTSEVLVFISNSFRQLRKDGSWTPWSFLRSRATILQTMSCARFSFFSFFHWNVLDILSKRITLTSTYFSAEIRDRSCLGTSTTKEPLP